MNTNRYIQLLENKQHKFFRRQIKLHLLMIETLRFSMNEQVFRTIWH